MKLQFPRIKTRLIVAILLVVLAVGGTTESGRSRINLVRQIENVRNTSTVESSFTTPSALAAAESLQVQRQAFLSVILSYLARPEENPDVIDSSDDEGNKPKVDQQVTDENNNNLTAGQSWSRFADSHIHLRVLRSTSEERQPEARGLFSRLHSSSAMSRRNNNPGQPFSGGTRQSSSSSTALGPPISSADLLAKLLRENLSRQRRRNHLINGEAEETSATIEVVQTRTPFVVMDGQMIMNDLPMVERRSIPQFGGMVILYTRASPLRLLYYGNWCGSGGMGPALDNIDQCCMTHDKCYGDVEKLPCKGIFQTPYSVHYAWRWVEDRKQAYCPPSCDRSPFDSANQNAGREMSAAVLMRCSTIWRRTQTCKFRTGDRCADMTCECDRIAASCFAKHMINAKLKGNRLRKHRNRIKHPVLRGQF